MIPRGLREGLWITAAVVLGAGVASLLGARPVYGCIGGLAGYLLGRLEGRGGGSRRAW